VTAVSQTRVNLQQAIALHQAGQLAEAEPLYRAILQTDPKCVDALHYLGVIGLQTGHPGVAVDLITQAAALAEGQPSVSSNLGLALMAVGRLGEAISHLQRALELKPDYPDALNNLGLALTTTGRLDEAITNLEKAVRLKPDFLEALNNLGNALLQRGRLDAALEYFRHALALRPNSADAHSNLGNLHRERGEIDEAIACYRTALGLEPQRANIHSNLVFNLHFSPTVPRATIDQELERWDRMHGAPLADQIQPHPNERIPERRLRIGYVSADFRAHPVGLNLLPLLRHHAHERSEIFCYSDVPRADDLTTEIKACADHWRETASYGHAALAALIRSDHIDLLVDLALHSASNRLLTFARKPAPIQLSFAGYPGRTGLRTIDYHFTDPHLERADATATVGADAPFALPDTFWCYDPRAEEQEIGPLPALAKGFITFGGLNTLAKVNDRVLDLWRRVLLATPDSRLRLLAAEGTQRDRLRSFFGTENISPDRIQFEARLPRPEYLALHRGIDVGLDTFPYNGHTTSLDSYWMGVPVVTLVGHDPVGRAGWSQLSNLGLTELAATTAEEFVRIASAVARDLPRLAELRSSLRARMRASSLMDAPRFARAIEGAYRTMWERWCAHPSQAPAPRS
jgi:protein O-GlcNAc transferase